jgi:hypothetical protein
MNISRNVKRLLVIIALSLIVILVSKSLLSSAVKNLSIAAKKKQQVKVARLPPTLAGSAAEITPGLESSSVPVTTGNMNTSAESSPVAVENTATGQ